MNIKEILKKYQVKKIYQDISAEYLHKLFRYENGNLFWKKRPANHFTNWEDKPAGCIVGFKYWRIGINGKYLMRSILIWIYHKGYVPKSLTWKNGCINDDRIENLKEIKNLHKIFGKKNCVKGYDKVHKGLTLINNRIYFYYQKRSVIGFPATLEGINEAIRFKKEFYLDIDKKDFPKKDKIDYHQRPDFLPIGKQEVFKE